MARREKSWGKKYMRRGGEDTGENKGESHIQISEWIKKRQKKKGD